MSKQREQAKSRAVVAAGRGIVGVGLVASLSLLTVGCADVGDGTEEVTGAAFADTSALPLPAAGSHNVKFNMCWDASAFKTGALQALYDAGRAAVQQEITDTWDANSWADFRWAANCNAGGIPIKIEDSTPRANRSSVFLNFAFANFRSAECKPTGGTGVNAAWTNCVKKNAVHEFGHLMGLDHEQNRSIVGLQCAPGDVAEQDIGAFSITGDLPFGAGDANSVMSYCWSRRTINLTPTDIDAIQSLYGAEARHVYNDGSFYAVRTDTTFLQVFIDATGLPAAKGTPRIERAYRIQGPVFGNGIRYGNFVNILLDDKKLCATLGVGDRFAITSPKLIFTNSPYDPGACNWEVRHNSSGSGGVSVEINDPVDLHLTAPTMPTPPGAQFSFIPFNQSLNVRFLGPFAPL